MYTQSIPFVFFFFNDTATTEIYTLSLHDALPISLRDGRATIPLPAQPPQAPPRRAPARSEEHTSELQSRSDLVCRLLLEKKKKIQRNCDCHDLAVLSVQPNRHTQPRRVHVRTRVC